MSNWMTWMFAVGAMGMAGAALQEVTSLKQEVRALVDELHRRDKGGPPTSTP